MAAPKTRLPLTRDLIIDAAIAFADEHGIEALSMRKLGHELGVEAMSLYNHVAGKDEILDGMVDRLFGRIVVPDAPDWKDGVRGTARAAKDVFVAHPWAVPLITSRGARGEQALALMDALLSRLLDNGYDPETAHHAWHVIASHVMGYAFQETTSPFGQEEEHDQYHEEVEALMRQLAARYPSLTRVAPYLMNCSHDEEFDYGLDIILSGIEARRPG